MTNEMSKRKYPQEMLLMNGCPNCGQEANRQFVENTIDEIVDLAVAEERKKIVEIIRKVTDYDHSKCPIKETCIGYQNCVSDIENGVISLINKTQ